MKNNVTNTAEAAAQIETKLAEAKAKLAALSEEVGTVSDEETAALATALEDFTTVTDRQWSLFALSNVRREIAALEATAAAELIFAAGKFVLVPKGERLVSPAGFHPDQCVFLKPSAGALVDKLPKASNLSYYDFTAA